MIKCDRCDRPNAVPVHVPLRVIPPNPNMAMPAMNQLDLCKECQEEYRTIVLKFLEPKPLASAMPYNYPEVSAAIEAAVKEISEGPAEAVEAVVREAFWKSLRLPA